MNDTAANPTTGCAIGVDVGGTKIAAGIVDPEGRVLEKRLVPTLPPRGGEAVLQDALGLAEALREETSRRGWKLAALGVGVCELVDTQGRVVSSQTLAWRGLPVREQFARLAPAILDADSRAAAFCEARCGAGRPFRSFLYVTVGTGIGSSLVLEGLPFVGAHGCTGTLATAPMSVLDPGTGRLTRAVLEEVASGPALVARYNQETGGTAMRAEDTLAAAAAGDLIAAGVVDAAATSLGATIALLVNVLDPEAVIVGGGLGAAPGLYWERLAPAIRAHIWSDVHRGLPLLQARHGGDAGFIGAALLALEHQRTHEPK
jgi:glucokinase